MDRLNSLNVGYLKKLPNEEIPGIIYDVAVNEINENWDDEMEIVQNLPEVVRVFYWIVRFSDLINYGGIQSFLTSESGYAYPQVIDSLKIIRATETAEVVEEGIHNVRRVVDMDPKTFIDVLKSQTLYELTDNTEMIYEIQDIDMALKAIDEPVYDYLLDFFADTLKGMNDEDFI